MMTVSDVCLFLHLFFIASFLGGQVYYLVIAQSATQDFFTPNDQAYFLKNILRRQNPILLLMLCLVVLSGGFMISPLKGALGANYFQTFGLKLIKKLGVFFIVFFVTAYQTLGVGFKIRYLEISSPLDVVKSTITAVKTRMFITAILNIILILITVYLARSV